MTFSQLHERLRLEMWQRIQRGVVTGKLLAAQTGLRPSHISNFLHRKRKLSLPALDKLLSAQQITIEELADNPPEADEPVTGNSTGTVRSPLITQASMVSLPIIPPRSVQAYITLPSSQFDRVPPRHASSRRSWERFIGLRVTSDQAMGMDPVLEELSLVVIDRHYNSLVPASPPAPNLYALILGGKLLFRYVTFDSSRLLLRPHSLSAPVEAVDLLPAESPSDLLVGRVCVHIREV